MKKKNNDISFGHRHEWTDTQGHAHKVVFDDATLEKPRATWIVLTVVATAALVIGGFFVATYEPSHNETPFRNASDEPPKFAFVRAVPRASELTRAMTPGWSDEFFLVDDKGLTLCNVSGETLERWDCFDGSESPTALEFVAFEESVATGALFIAFPDKIYGMHFSLDEYAKSEDEKDKTRDEDEDEATARPRRTAARGALTKPELLLTLADGNIRGMAASSDKLFVADFDSQRIKRFSLQKILTNRDENKNIAPECELGEPDEAVAYPGLKPAFERNFRIAYSRDANALYAANSGLYRIDAFDAITGSWNSAASWSRQPGTPRGFGGAANPIAFDVDANLFVAVEAGRFGESEKNSDKGAPIQFYDKIGEWLAETALGSDLGDGVALLDVEFVDDAQAFCVLRTDGRIEIYEAR